MNDNEVNRQRMIADHLMQRGISDRRVLSAMDNVKRELFVPSDLKNHAYDDNPLSIGYKQTISQPYIVAYMTEKLKVKNNHKVLEIGTGSGYQTAILAELALFVYTVERIEELAFTARQTFRYLGIDNVKSIIDDGSKGYKEEAPYDRIMVTAAAENAPKALLEQLADNGKMVIPVGKESGVQELLRITRVKDSFKTEHLCYVRFVPLIRD